MASGGGQDRGPDRRRRPLRPVGANPLRPIDWVLVALAAIAVGYALGLLQTGGGDSRPKPAGDGAGRSEVAPAPWYRTRPAPPQMVTAPGEPIFPDDAHGGAGTVRPYEEALPRDVYVPPPGRVAPPAATVPGVVA